MPAELAATLDTSDVFGSVPATSENGGLLYDIAMTIGGQVLNMDLDTGSSDLWVYTTYFRTMRLTSIGGSFLLRLTPASTQAIASMIPPCQIHHNV